MDALEHTYSFIFRKSAKYEVTIFALCDANIFDT